MSEKDNTKVIPEFKLGADPEFCCVDGEVLYNANNFSTLTDSSELGRDGSGVPLEVRPNPEVEPLNLVKNIGEIFKRAILKEPDLTNYEWRAGAVVKEHPTGGHIHFGIKDIYDDIQRAAYYLDQYVGATSLLLENPVEGKKRRYNFNYGKRCDHRAQHHGMEYRVPSSWIMSPKSASAILCLSKTVMFEIIKGTNLQLIGGTEYDINECRLDNIRNNFGSIWKDIKKMTLYPKYKKELDAIYTWVKNKQTWESKLDMKQAWKLGVSTEKIKKFDLDEIWNKYRKSVKLNVGAVPTPEIPANPEVIPPIVIQTPEPVAIPVVAPITQPVPINANEVNLNYLNQLFTLTQINYAGINTSQYIMPLTEEVQ